LKQSTRTRIEALNTPRARLIAGAAVAIFVVSLLLNNLRADPPSKVEAAQGDGAEVTTTFNTTPFVPARPDVTGSTTIPSGAFETEPDRTPGSTSTTYLNPSGTTSSIPLAGLQADSVCNAYLDVYRTVAAASEARTSVERMKAAVVGPLESVVERLRSADPDEFTAAADLYQDIRDGVERASTLPGLEGQVIRLAGADPKSAAAKAPILDHMRTACPDALVGL
jgi:hypothetical protein